MWWLRKKNQNAAETWWNEAMHKAQEHTKHLEHPLFSCATSRKMLAAPYRVPNEPPFDWARIVLSNQNVVIGLILESIDRPNEYAAKVRVGNKLNTPTCVHWFATVEEAIVFLQAEEDEYHGRV